MLAKKLVQIALGTKDRGLSDAEAEARVMLYVETLLPRHPLDVILEAIDATVLEWEWFPAIAEVHQACIATRNRRYAIANPAPAVRDKTPDWAIEDKRSPEEKAKVAEGMKTLTASLGAKLRGQPTKAHHRDRDSATTDEIRGSLRRVREWTEGVRAARKASPDCASVDPDA